MSELKSRLREANKKIEELEAELKNVIWSRDLFKHGMDLSCETGSKFQKELTAVKEYVAEIDKNSSCMECTDTSLINEFIKKLSDSKNESKK